MKAYEFEKTNLWKFSFSKPLKIVSIFESNIATWSQENTRLMMNRQWINWVREEVEERGCEEMKSNLYNRWYFHHVDEHEYNEITVATSQSAQHIYVKRRSHFKSVLLRYDFTTIITDVYTNNKALNATRSSKKMSCMRLNNFIYWMQSL